MAMGARFVNWIWFRPKRLEKILRRQEGLQGNSYRLLVAGDMKEFISVSKQEQSRSMLFSDSFTAHVLPYYNHEREIWPKRIYMVWAIAEPHLMKEILPETNTFHNSPPELFAERIGRGIPFLDGAKWAKHRKIVNPAFHLDKLKNMVPAICLSCASMIDKWEAESGGEESFEIDVWPHFEDLSGDMLSRTAFGSSHEEGKRIFELQTELVKLALEVMFLSFIPGWRYIPTKASRRMSAISDEIQSLITGIINQRQKLVTETSSRSKTTTPPRPINDLLGILMESNAEEIAEEIFKHINTIL